MPDPTLSFETTSHTQACILTPLTLDHKRDFDRQFAATGVSLSDYSFANNICWQLHQRHFVTAVAGCMCLLALREGELLMPLPPLGQGPAQASALAACVALLERANPGPKVGDIRFVSPDLLPGLLASQGTWLRGHTLEVLPEHPDYLYRRAEMVELRGAAYKSKRSDINQLLRTHPQARALPLRQGDAGRVRALSRLWLRQRGNTGEMSDTVEGDPYEDGQDEESVAIGVAMRNFDALGLFGVRLMIGERLVGVTLGERMPTGVINVLFEKTDRSVPGAAQFIFREFCRALPDGALINTGDGCGSPSLARAKDSYRPVQLADKVLLRILRETHGPA